MKKLFINFIFCYCVSLISFQGHCQGKFKNGVLCILRSSQPTKVEQEKADVNSKIEIYNDDNSIYFSTPMYSDSYNIPKDFTPYAIELEDDILIMEVVKVEPEFYIVKINNKNLKKVRKDNSALTYLSIKDFILKYDMTISFNHKLNPIRKYFKKELPFKNLLLDYKSTFFSPKEIKEDWLKVEFEPSNNNKKQSGWIKWKNKKNELLIQFNLFE